MKKSTTLLFALIMIFAIEGSFAQKREKPKQKPLYENGVYKPFDVLDTRVDNMSYWNKAAELGLTPYNPDVVAPIGTYTSSRINATSVVRDDSPDVPVTTENSTQSENSIFVDPNDPDHVLQSNNSTQNPVGNLYGANYFFSYDYGSTWGGTVQGAGGGNSGDPATAIGLSGRQYVGFIHNNYGQGVAYSDNGTTWTSVQSGTSPGGGGMLDKNHLWIDNSPTSPYQGYVYDAWTAFGNTNDSDIEFVRSTNNGISYSTHKNVSSAVNAGSHCQGVNIQTGPNGEVYVIFSIYDGWPTDESAIGLARSLDGGATFTPATRIISNIKGIRNTGVSKNQRVNSFPSAAVDLANGNIYVTWTNCGVPGVNSGADRDIYMIRSENQGTTWTTPIRVNQDPIGMGKKHYFPWITCDPETGALSTIFYDDRNVGGSQCEVYCANSFDGGDTWEDFKVSDVAFTPTPIPGLAGSYMGDYLGISARGGKVYPVWCDTRSGYVMTYVSPYETNSLPRPTDLIGSVTFETGAVQLNWSFVPVADFQYFIVYRDNFQIATTTDPFYTDNLPDYGIFKYKVTAMHLTGESSGPSATIQWGDPHVAVDPTEIIENIELGATSTRYINVTNVGQLDLIYSISSSTVPTKGRAYCDASTTTEDEFIANVSFGDINNSSGWQGGVADYTTQVTPMEVGTSQNITVTNGNDWASDIVYVWVDWNDDFTFNQSADEEYQLTNVGGAGHTFTGSISVPSGTPSGEHRMRVRMTYSTAPTPCGSASYGEIEDYTISVSGWMFVDRVTDTIAPGTSAVIAVNFDSQDLVEGTYYGNVKVETNDPLLSEVNVPITLTVGGTFPLALQVVANPATICNGSYSQLAAIVSGGTGSYTYSWTSDPAGFTSTEQNPVVYPTVTTTYFVEVNDGASTLTQQATITVLNLPLQAASPEGVSDLCFGEYQTVYSTTGSAGAETYLWLIWPVEAGTFEGNGLTATITWSETFTGGASIWVIPFNACGEGPESAHFPVEIHPTPVVNLGDDMTVCANWTVTLDAGVQAPGSTFLWSTGETTQTIVVDTTGVGIGGGAFSVEVMTSAGCTKFDEIAIQFDDCTGLQEVTDSWSVDVFPNPSNGIFNIELRSNYAKPVQMRIFNAIGIEVYAKNNILINQTNNIPVNLEKYSEGVYYLNLSGEGINIIKKVVIQK